MPASPAAVMSSVMTIMPPPPPPPPIICLRTVPPRRAGVPGNGDWAAARSIDARNGEAALVAAAAGLAYGAATAGLTIPAEMSATSTTTVTNWVRCMRTSIGLHSVKSGATPHVAVIQSAHALNHDHLAA